MPSAAFHSYFWLDQGEPPPPPPTGYDPAQFTVHNTEVTVNVKLWKKYQKMVKIARRNFSKLSPGELLLWLRTIRLPNSLLPKTLFGYGNPLLPYKT